MPNITTGLAITYTNFNIGLINTKLEICVLSDYVGLMLFIPCLLPSMRIEETDKIEANNCKVELLKRIFHLCMSHDLACMQSYDVFKVLTTLVEISLEIALSI